MTYLERNLGIDTLFVSIFVLLVIERLISTFIAPKPNPTRKIYHKNFFYILLFVYLLIVFLSFGNYLSINHLNLLISIPGVFLLLCGIYLRNSAIRVLGKYWSLFIEIKKEHKIVRTGVYRHFKHPYYLAVLLELIGFSMICNALVPLIMIIVIQFPLLLVRIYIEEKALRIYFRGKYE